MVASNSTAPTARSPRRARQVAPLLATLALATLACAGCTAANAAPTPGATTLPACRAPEAAVLPDTAGSLTESDSGSYCLPLGQGLDVFLTAPANGAPTAGWSRIAVGDTAILGYGNSGVLTAPLGVTPGVFVGRQTGSTTLVSTLPDGTAWRVTIVVR
jgi:hypothetical protein